MCLVLLRWCARLPEELISAYFHVKLSVQYFSFNMSVEDTFFLLQLQNVCTKQTTDFWLSFLYCIAV